MRDVIVETFLGRPGRTRLVERSPPLRPRAPQVGDPWEPLTVRARLERMGETYRRLPHAPDTRPQQIRSCMPTPVREVFKDSPPEPMRLLPSHADIVAANHVVDVLTGGERSIAWAIANRMGDRALGRHLRTSHHTAAKRKQDVLALLAEHWNTLEWRPDAEDASRAQRFIHRDFK